MCDTLQSVCLQLLTATVQSSPGGKNQPDSAEKREEDTEVTQKIKVEKKLGLICSLRLWGTICFSLCFSPLSPPASVPGQALAPSCCQFAFLQPFAILQRPGTSWKASAWLGQEVMSSMVLPTKQHCWRGRQGWKKTSCRFFLSPKTLPLSPPTSIPISGTSGSQRAPVSSGCPLPTPLPAWEDGMKPSLFQDGILDGKF